jgi:hypothetical protein
MEDMPRFKFGPLHAQSRPGKLRSIKRQPDPSLALLHCRSTRDGGFRHYSPSFQRRACFRWGMLAAQGIHA